MKKRLAILALFTLFLAGRALAQIRTGEASMNLNGTISAGYGDDYSNVAGSNHSVFGAGQADLSGSYYNPNFLSFDIQPFYNQSRLNSAFQSMTAASGVSANAHIFSGSQFPGSLSYSTTYDETGNYGIPGLPNFTSHGHSDVLALNWGVHVEDWPSLNISFSDSHNNYSVYGADTTGTLHADSLSVTSAYRLAGFNMTGGYQHTGVQSVMPEFLSGESSDHNDSGSNSFFFGVGHKLPLHGSFSAGGTHEEINTVYDYDGTTNKYNTTIDTLTSGLSFTPVTRLNVGASGYYTDNLEGTLYNTLLTAGVAVPQGQTQAESHALSLIGNANYEMPAQHLDFHAFVQHQQQSFFGNSFDSDTYNGTATYSKPLLGGFFNGVLGLTRTSVSTTHHNLLGVNASVNYTHSIRRWDLAGAFSYAQDTQTVLINYTTSGYSYNGTVGRRIRRRWYWGGYASGSRSLLTNVPGSANSSQSYGTSFSLSRLSMTGSYSMSNGNSLLTPTGLVSTPVPLPVVNPAAVVLFNGKSYSAGLGAQPIRRLTLTANYAKSLSTTNSNSLLSSNNNEIIFFLMTYNIRKLTLAAGYSQLIQGFSVTGMPATRENSIFVGISRWFNFF